ncbi:MAG: hypothetical protein CL908_18240 [Deltaproteobacteria bacterium]|nr:hypothetical protein [Deltaproteobacteria bacterium]
MLRGERRGRGLKGEMNFARNAAGLLLTSAVGIPISFATSVVLARFLSVEDRGIYSLLTTFALVAVILGQMGWPTASIYRLRRVGSPAQRVATTGVVAVVVISTMIVLSCWQLRPLLSERFLNDAPARLFHLAVAAIPLQLLSLFFGSLARGTDRFVIQNAYKVLLDIGTLAIVCWALIVRDGALLELMVASLAIQAVCCSGYALAVLRHTGLSFGFDWRETRESMAFGLKSYLQALAGQIHERIDVFMIAYLLRDPEQVAFYAIAVGIVQRIMIVPTSIGSAAYPQLAGLGRAAGAEFAARINRQSLLSVLAAALVLALIVPWAVPLVFGEPYRASVMPLEVLLPGVAMFSIYKTLSRYFTAIDRQQANISTQIVSVIVNVLLNLWWIPLFGIMGAALASLASYALEAVLISIVFSRSTGVRLRTFLVVRREDFVQLRTHGTSFLRRVRTRD